MIKVCHVTSVHKTDDVRIFEKECSTLAEAGYDVTLVGKGASVEKNGVHIKGVKSKVSNRLERILFFSRKVYKSALEVDANVYHLHDPELLPYALKFKEKGKIVIFDSHENTAQTILEKYYIPKMLRKTIYKIYTAIEGKVCRKIDAVVIVTPGQKEYFQQFNAHIWQITNYPILQKMKSTPNYSSKRLGFAGGIREQWNHHNVLKALEKLPDWRYTLAGGGGQRRVT